MIAWLGENNIGKKQTQYKLRDWVFSRQRYWGEPIPLVYCDNCARKKPKILYVHGIYGHDKENWVPWFKKEMEARGYEVLTPNLPENVHPTLDGWVKALGDLKISKDDKLFVVAHSLGVPAACQFILKYKLPVGKLILVGPTGLQQGEKNWENLRKAGCDEKSLQCIRDFSQANVGLGKLKKLVGETIIYLSDNDPYIPASIIESYRDASPRVRNFKNKGHFNESAGVLEFPEILEEFESKIENLKSEINNGWIPLPEKDLPLKLPKVEKYEPTDTGESPLAAMESWVKTKCPRCGGPARRETDVMPNWAGSSWYFLRYCDPHNKKEFAGQDKMKYWGPIDWYNGGMEHTVLHLLYSRFWNQFLFDRGLVPFKEPYKKRTSHGLILAEDGEKMSKSRGNVVNPDEMVEKFGADALRAYIMFMGPFDQAVAWSTDGLKGVKRFLDRVWNLQKNVILSEAKDLDSSAVPQNDKIETLVNKTIKKVSEDIEQMKFNTAIAALMELTNEFYKIDNLQSSIFSLFVKILSPFAPHLCEELWHELGNKTSIAFEPWPQYDPNKIQDETITIAVQVNGKLRDTFEAPADISETGAKARALESEKIQKWLAGKEPKKVIYVKGKLVSIVV